MLEKNCLDVAVDQHLRADQTGLGRAVDLRAFQTDAVGGGLDDYVLLGVQPPAEFVPLARGNAQLFTQAADVQTVLKTGRSAVVTRGQDPLVLNGQSPDLAAQAGGTLGHEPGYAHEIIRPWKTLQV